MVHDAVDGACGGHRIFEDPVPLAEDEVAGDDHAPPLVALGEEGEEHLHLLAALLHVTDVVEDHRVVAVERRQLLLEPEIALRDEEPLHERVGRGEEHAMAALRSARGRWRRQSVSCLGRGGQRQRTFSPRSRIRLRRGWAAASLPSVAGARVSVASVFSAGEVRVLEVALDPSAPPLLDLELGEVVKVLLEGPALALGLRADLRCVARERRAA